MLFRSDLVKSGDYSLTCASAAGSCVDLSGTAAGFMTTTLNLAAGTYFLSFDYTGNQLGAQYPTANFQVTAGSLDMTIGPLTSTSAIFTTYTGLFSFGSSGPVAITFRQLAGGVPFRTLVAPPAGSPVAFPGKAPHARHPRTRRPRKPARRSV